jgi:hypothetical protein
MAATRCTEDGGNCDPQDCAEGNEIPQRGKSENKNQAAADGEEQAHKSGPERQFVHGDAGMPFFTHG